MTATTSRTYATAIDRWASMGPYYAMFPVPFAFTVVQEYSARDGGVLDPFAGRASSIFAAAATGRRACGVEMNPVGWIYGDVKLKPASKARVLKRLEAVAELGAYVPQAHVDDLPEFFSYCFCPSVLRFLMAARSTLDWKRSRTDRTVAAFLLTYLHGKKPSALSNQMRQSKSMAPGYSVRWWRDHGEVPPEHDPVAFLRQRVEWRYAMGTPTLPNAQVLLGDSADVLPRLVRRQRDGKAAPFDLLFTSPPYHAVTNYQYDHWLRLWVLGGEPRPQAAPGCPGRFWSRQAYSDMLHDVLKKASRLMASTPVIYIRTDARPITLGATLDAVGAAFPRLSIRTELRPLVSPSQTALYGDLAPKPGEVDVIAS